MGPRTCTVVPRAGGATPSGRRTAMPPVPSAIAMSGGMPSRPASAVTTPATDRTVPTGAPRASTTSTVGGGVGPGVAVGAVVRLGVGAVVVRGAADGDEAGLGADEGPDDAVAGEG